MAPTTRIISGDDFQEILSDALTSFSPLAVLVGSQSARAFAHEVTNKKQTMFATLAPIGALGMMATVCRSSDLPGIKDLLGTGDSDIYDAAADIGCYTLIGLVPKLSRRGGLSCRERVQERGRSACAIVNLEWTLGERAIDFKQLREILHEFSASTISGRVEWSCDNLGDLLTKLKDVRESILSSLGEGHLVQDSDRHMTMYDALENHPGGSGVVELHWPSPSMPLETRPYIIYISITFFIVIFAAIAAFTASPLIAWQSAEASALLFGGQTVLALGQMCSHFIVGRIRTTKTIVISSNRVVPTWTMVDQTWFTSTLARRPLASSISGGRVRLGQHHSFSATFVPRWQALTTLFLLVCGFIAFYVGAKSSDVRTVVIFIALYVLANGSKGNIVHLANECYYTTLNNFGYQLMVTKVGKVKKPWWKWWKTKIRTGDSKPDNGEDMVQKDKNSPQTEVFGEREATSIGPDYIVPILQHQDVWDMPADAVNPTLIPLPPSHNNSTPRTHSSSYRSRRSSLKYPSIPLRPPCSPPPSRGRAFGSGPADHDQMHRPSATSHQSSQSLKLSRSSRGAEDDEPIATDIYPERIPLPLSRPSSIASSRVPAAKLPVGPVVPGQSLHQIEYRLYAKVAVRHPEGIGMFYFASKNEWAMAAHIIYEVAHRYLGDAWQPPTAKESICEINIQFRRRGGNGSTKLIHAFLLLLVDTVRYEDVFWSAGQEICAIIMNCFNDTDRLPSEHPRSTDIEVMAEWVYNMTKFMLTAQGMYGSRSLMRSIDLVMAKFPYDDSVWVNSAFWSAAEQAASDLMKTFNQAGPVAPPRPPQ